jgi:hypothetical protein
MRTMLRITIPVENGNAAIKDGSMGQVVGSALERLKPEAAYFTADGGKRTAYLVIDVADATDIPSIAEPFFVGLNAQVELLPVMNADELKAGLEKLAKLL